MRKQRFFLYLFIATATVELIILSETSSKLSKNNKLTNDELTICLPRESVILHPHRANNKTSLVIVKHIYEGLFRVNDDNEIEFALASGVHISDYGTKYTFTLNNTFWSNGDVFTAYDFEKCIQSSLLSDLSSEKFKRALKCICGVDDFLKTRVTWKKVGIKAIDESILCITLAWPNPNFIEQLTEPVFFPVYPRWNNSLTPSNGAFMVEDLQLNGKIILRKNKKYINANKIKTKSIEFIPLKTSEIHQSLAKGTIHCGYINKKQIDIDLYKQIETPNRLETITINEVCFTLVLSPENHELLKRFEFRKALAQSLDKQSAIDGSYITGEVTHKFTNLKQSPDITNESLRDETTEFKTEIISIIKTDPITLELVVEDGFPSSLANSIKNQLNKTLNIPVQIKLGNRNDKTSNTVPIICKALHIDNISPYSFIKEMNNDAALLSGTNNASISEYLKQIAYETNKQKLITKLGRIERLILDEYIFIPICNPILVFAINKKVDKLPVPLFVQNFSKAYW